MSIQTNIILYVYNCETNFIKKKLKHHILYVYTYKKYLRIQNLFLTLLYKAKKYIYKVYIKLL